MEKTNVEDFMDNACENPSNRYNKECNKLLSIKEQEERRYLGENPDEDLQLYPDVNDPNFNLKIAKKKEFNDTQYDGRKRDIETYADSIKTQIFELAPHQLFVKNFLSFQTPYNSLLLYHQLGTGKTCSAIGICEEMRVYLKDSGITKRILIVASPNVQDNFRLQLFDERKLKLKDGLWSVGGCIGNTYIKELNPTNIKDIPKEKIISQVKALISKSYYFMGYESFSNYITRVSMGSSNEVSEKQIIKRLQNEFSNRLIVIDEVHNIRNAQETGNKKVATQLMKLVTYVENIRLLLLSATPMYNSVREIVWLLNLMNINDRRSQMNVKDIFNAKGELKEEGKQILIQKATGYISYIRGENPYTFPFRVYPNIFNPDHTFLKMTQPTFQINGKHIKKDDRITTMQNKLFLTNIGDYQSNVYKIMVNNMQKNVNTTSIDEISQFSKLDGFTYTLLQYPMEALVMTYPMEGVTEYAANLPSIEHGEVDEKELIETAIEDKTEEAISTIDDLGAESMFILKDEMQEVEEDVEEEAEDLKEDAEEEAEDLKEDLEKKAEVEQSKPEIFVIKPKNRRCPNGTHYNKKEERCIENKPKPQPQIGVNEKIEEINIDIGQEQDGQSKPELFIIKPKRRRCPNGTHYNKKEERCIENKPKPQIKRELEEEIVEVEITRKPSSEVSIASTGGNPDANNEKISIDTTSLTGKKGLSRIMNFKDSITPPIKGQFSYKSDKYGRIFSLQEVGKYSSKIKIICDEIMKSSGIVLIYSQWIDAGLIPMALALEELGFVRSNNTTLFENPQAPPIDAITLQPRNETTTKFMPARYSMITGDNRLSPDNNEEINMITNENNTNGEKVKVVLISKAASEGIDLKCIRQVHILEPWYTMSRLEQIIGRAVRTFSHIALPFKERNVEIFLHGTLLENTEDESVDLYIYRIAEQKARQIGEVSRLLKETAVDCLLNTDQNNFTAENMNTNVEQVLSNGMVVNDFRVGDLPYSSMCDYMENCDIKCIPNVTIKPDEITEYTYTESFIRSNSDKIIQKIKMLMTEDFFYKKDNLLARINHPKQYPLVEIYSALTQLIEDVTETITDKYGRTGRLTNIGEYYIFQPIELTMLNTSRFDVSVPIDYKPISFSIRRIDEPLKDLHPEIVQSEVDILEEQPTDIKVPINTTPNIIKEIMEKYDVTKEYTHTNIERGDKNYYRHLGVALHKIQEVFGISYENMYGDVIEHIVDMLPFKQKLDLLNYITNIKELNEKDADYYMKNTIKLYFDKFIIHDNQITGIVMYDLSERHIIILNMKTNTWKEAQEEDKRDLEDVIKKRYSSDDKEFNEYVGFIGSTAKEKELSFRVKNMKTKRSQGGKCDNSTKAKNIGLLNNIIGTETFTKENTKKIMDMSICCIQEMLLRYYNKSKPERIWFLDPDSAREYGVNS